MASRQMRKQKLQGVLDNILKKLDAHHHAPTGGASSTTTTILSEQQLAHLQQRSQVYRHQIEELDRELDEVVCMDLWKKIRRRKEVFCDGHS